MPDEPRACAPPVAAVVDDVMLRTPTTWPTGLSLDAARELLADDHLHALLLVDGRRLRGVVVAADLEVDDQGGAPPPSGGRVLDVSALEGRTVLSGTPLHLAEALLRENGGRRLAVVDGAGGLVGLLCRKRRTDGYCTDAGVAARRTSRGAG